MLEVKQIHDELVSFYGTVRSGVCQEIANGFGSAGWAMPELISSHKKYREEHASDKIKTCPSVWQLKKYLALPARKHPNTKVMCGVTFQMTEQDVSMFDLYYSGGWHYYWDKVDRKYKTFGSRVPSDLVKAAAILGQYAKSEDQVLVHSKFENYAALTMRERRN